MTARGCAARAQTDESDQHVIHHGLGSAALFTLRLVLVPWGTFEPMCVGGMFGSTVGASRAVQVAAGVPFEVLLDRSQVSGNAPKTRADFLSCKSMDLI
jgi:hypothetical protein